MYNTLVCMLVVFQLFICRNKNTAYIGAEKPPMRSYKMVKFNSTLFDVFLICILRQHNGFAKIGITMSGLQPSKERGPQEFQVLEMTLLSSGQQPDVKVC